MKKYIALLLAIVLCLTVLAGCASQQTPDVSEPEDTTPEQTTTQTETPAVDETAETQDVELWYYWETESHQITLQAAIDAYNASQTAYKVTAKYVPFADFKKQLSIGAVAEALPDMVILDSPDHASYASSLTSPARSTFPAILKAPSTPAPMTASSTAFRSALTALQCSTTRICWQRLALRFLRLGTNSRMLL